MIRSHLLALASLLLLTSCSSVGVYSLQQNEGFIVAPTRILVEPFRAPISHFSLGSRSAEETGRLRDEIVANLAERTIEQLRLHAAAASVLDSAGQIRPGVWLVRGEILQVSQGSRALRAIIGFGFGRTTVRTRVTVFEVTSAGMIPLISFNTTGASGLEPGAALGVATGGVGSAFAIVNAGASVLMSSLPGVSSDVERTSYETSAVISAYLERNGLLASDRKAISPNMKGKLPKTMNLNRAIPAPLRPRGSD